MDKKCSLNLGNLRFITVKMLKKQVKGALSAITYMVGLMEKFFSVTLFLKRLVFGVLSMVTRLC